MQRRHALYPGAFIESELRLLSPVLSLSTRLGDLHQARARVLAGALSQPTLSHHVASGDRAHDRSTLGASASGAANLCNRQHGYQRRLRACLGGETSLFRFGRTAILDVLNAEASLATAETAVAASDAALADDQVNVFLALGGGWQTGDDR